MAEWSNAAVLKTVDLRGSGGSNPSLSATEMKVSVFFIPGTRSLLDTIPLPELIGPHYNDSYSR